VDRLVMLLLASKANREAVREGGVILRDQFPLGTRRILEALRSGRDPGGNGIVFLSGSAQRPAVAAGSRTR
jgi:hypothetical protein